MSSPTKGTSEMRSQDSAHSSSQYVVGDVLQDTASSARHIGLLPSSSTTISSVAPNSAFVRRHKMSRTHSASPRPQRTLLLLGVSVTQRRARDAEQTAESVMSGVGRVAEETRRVRGVAEAAIAEAKSVHDAVESKVASLAGACRSEHHAHNRSAL